MITVEEAHRILLSELRDYGTEEISLMNGIGRVLKEDWYTDRPLPPYDRVTMDGIAINYDHIKNNHTSIAGIAAAGDPQKQLVDRSACYEVMTGSILPKGTDTVIRYEDLDIKNGVAHINAPFKKQQNIHFEGQDKSSGDLAVSSNTLLSPSEIGVGASIGKTKIKVAKLPRTIVISTGDELVEIDQKPEQHQIRRSNVYRIASTISSMHIPVDTYHLPDDLAETKNQLTSFLDKYDLIILSGGVSKGKFDFLPQALTEIGVQKLFHKIKQRPGKPFWFGTHPKGTVVFALPGNPVSSFMCTQIYFIDWLKLSIGIRPTHRPHAILTKDVTFKPDLTYFLEVSLSYNDQGQILATPQKGNGSGDLSNLTNADAFIQLPQQKSEFKAGEVFPIYYYR